MTMHDFQRVARSHDNVFRRADKEDDDETTTTSKTSSSTSASSTSTSSTSTSTKASTTSTASSTTQTSSASKTTATTSTSDALDLSSILGLSSTTSSTASHTTTSSSSASTSATLTNSSSAHVATETLTSSVAAASATASDSAKSNSSGLSGAETGGIVAGCILAGLALLIFAIRKTFIRRRQRKRNTWGAGVFPDVNDKYSGGNSDLPPPLPEKGDYLGVSNAASPRTPVWAPARPTSPNPSAYQLAPPAAPSATYNNPMMDALPSLPPQVPMGVADPVGFRPGTTQTFRPTSAVGETAFVRVVYVPTLPDELSISAGEIVSVIKAYDDGWALCQNSRGEQGVCPLECLDRSQSGNHMIQQGLQSDAISVHSAAPQDGDWRNVKRLSSLSSQQQHY